jgi:hypothetical protein
MTTIKPEAPLRRETGLYYRGHVLIVELHPGYLVLRQKGRRDRVSVDYQAILELGYRIRAKQAAIERAEKRKRPALRRRASS